MYYREMMAALNLSSQLGILVAVVIVATADHPMAGAADASWTIVDVGWAIFWASPVGCLMAVGSAALFVVTTPGNRARW